jgi:Leucine-rich repeat (LRR) protein
MLQAGLEKLPQLKTLFISNNKLRDWSELDRLAGLEQFEVSPDAATRKIIDAKIV